MGHRPPRPPSDPSGPASCSSTGSCSPLVDSRHRGVAQPGSAPEWGSGGREFESRRPDRIVNLLVDTDGVFWCHIDATNGLPR